MIIAVLGIYLIISTISDLRYRTISLKLSAFVIVLMCIVKLLIYDTLADFDIILALIPGAFIIFVGYISKEAIGYGDGLVFLVCGVALNLKDTILLLFLAFLLSAIWSIFLILIKGDKKATIPFVPFISCAYVILLINTQL